MNFDHIYARGSVNSYVSSDFTVTATESDIIILTTWSSLLIHLWQDDVYLICFFINLDK